MTTLHQSGNACSIKIGTRDSTLAMHQTKHVRDKLLALHPSLIFSIESMKTIGDKILDVALSKIGSKSLFTKELEEALAHKYIHLVVHSLKDMPTSLPEGMVIAAVLKREDPRDAILLHPRYHGTTELQQLPHAAVLGSSSVRRIAQLRRHFPGLQFESVRGNLNTRLNKLLSSDHYSGLVLAAAGIHRMGWTDKISKYLESEECMYAVGQGALAVECLSSDSRTLSLLQDLSDADTLLATVAERALMAALAGGCSAPVAVWTNVGERGITLRGGVWSLDGQEELIEELNISFSAGSKNSVSSNEAENSNDSNDVFANNCAASATSDHALPSSNCHGANKRHADDELVDEPPKKVAKSYSAAGPTCSRDDKNEGPVDSSSCSEAQVESTNGSASVTSFCGIVPPPHLLQKAAIAHALGESLAKVLINKGADKILTEAKCANELLPPNLRPANKPEAQQ